MKLITETIDEVEFLTEEKDGKRVTYVQGPCVQAEIKNRNGRLYPFETLKREVERYVQEKVKTGAAMGELGHPSGPQLNLDRVTHLFTEVKEDGKNWIGKARLVDTPMGQIARGLLESGARIGFSSRGLGTLKRDAKLGADVVQEDFRLMVLSDIVADPSAPDAFVRGIMEGTEFHWDEKRGWIQELAHETKKELAQLTVRQLEEQKLGAFQRFLESVSLLSEKKNRKSANSSEKYAKARARASKEGRQHDAEYIRKLMQKL